MANKVFDRVQEITSTKGTGPIVLGGASPGGYRTVKSVMADGDTFEYCWVDPTSSSWEVGLGTYSAVANSVTRTTVEANSTGTTTAINMPGNSGAYVFLTLSAAMIRAMVSAGLTVDGASLVLNSSGQATVNAKSLDQLSKVTLTLATLMPALTSSLDLGNTTPADILALLVAQANDVGSVAPLSSFASGDQVVVARSGVLHLAPVSLFSSGTGSSSNSGGGTTTPPTTTPAFVMSSAIYADRGDGSGKKMLTGGTGAATITLPANGAWLIKVQVRGGTAGSYATPVPFVNVTDSSNNFLGAAFYNNSAIAMNNSGQSPDPGSIPIGNGAIHVLALESVPGTGLSGPTGPGSNNVYADGILTGSRGGNYGIGIHGAVTLSVTGGTNSTIAAGIFDVRLYDGSYSAPGNLLGEWQLDNSGTAS